MTVLITRGLPGSGKTTEARKWRTAANPGVRLITDRDSLREMMYDRSGLLSRTEEEAVGVAQRSMMRDLLARGYSVAVADTNLRQDRLTLIVQIATEYRHDIEWIDLRDVPVEVCIERDAARAALGQRHVGSDVIRAMAEKYGLPLNLGVR